MTIGQRDLVVFLPSVFGDASFWEPQRRALEPYFDLLSHEFRRPAHETNLETFADDVADAIEAAGHGAAHLVGLGLGAAVALQAFHRHAGRVRSLTLVSTWAHLPEAGTRIAWAQAELSRMPLAEFVRRQVPTLVSRTADPALVERCIHATDSMRETTFLARWRAMLRADARPVLPQVDVPLLLVGGSKDPVAPPRPLLEDAHHLAPGARLVVFEGASRFVNLDQPERFNRELAAFLAACADTPERCTA